MNWLQKKVQHKQEQEHIRRLQDMAKEDAATCHNLVDLEKLGTLTEKHVEALAVQALKTHTLTADEKAVYLPVFKAEVHRLELDYCCF